MKKIFAVVILASVSTLANACTVKTYTSSSQVRVARDRAFGFKNFDAICERLRAENAALLIAGDAGILNGNSLGWAVITVVDKNGWIYSGNGGGSTTHIGEQGTMLEATALLRQAIDDSIEKTNFEMAIGGLNSVRSQLKAAKR